MNKAELIRAAETLIAKIDRLETQFDELYPDLINPELEYTDSDLFDEFAGKVDKEGSAAIKTFLIKLKSKIDAISDDKSLVAIEHQLLDADKDYTKILRKRDKLITPTVSPKDPANLRDQILMKVNLVTITNFLKSDFPSPPYYEKDTKFKAAKDAVEKSRTTATLLINDLIKGMGSRGEEETEVTRAKRITLPEALAVLESSYHQQSLLRQAAQKEMDRLDKYFAPYEKAVQDKKLFLESATVVATLPKDSLALIGKSDKLLALEIAKLQDQIKDLRLFPDSVDAFFAKGGTLADVEVAARNCQAEVGAYKVFHEDLNTKYTKFAQKIAEDISQTIANFNIVYDDISRQIDASFGDKKALVALKTKFDSILTADKEPGVGKIVLKHNQALKLKAIFTELEASIPSLIKDVSKTLQDKIDITRAQIDGQIKEVEDKIVRFKLTSPEEKALVAKVRSYKSGQEHRIANPDVLKSIHATLLTRQGEFDTDIEELNRRLAKHTAVAAVLTRKDAGSQFDFAELARCINTSAADGKAIFVTLNQYLGSTDGGGDVSESTFTSQLADHLALFNATGLKAIKEFIEPKTSPEANVLKEKLAFIDICVSKEIPYQPYLESGKANVIAATLQLKKWGLDAYISMPTATSKTILNNETFCDALLVLKEFNINPTATFVDKLSVDLEKCEFIIRKVNKALTVLRGPDAEIEPTLEMVEALLENVEHNDIICEKVSGVLPILKESGIKPTWEIVQQLLRDPNKCDVIEKQSITQTDPNKKILPYTFKALLEQVLATEDKDVMKAMLAVHKHAPAHFGPWLLFLVKESPQLREILTKEDSTVITNLPFIIPLFKELPRSMDILHVLKPAEMIESELDKMILIASMKTKMQVRLEHYGPVFDALRNANSNPLDCALPKMARFMTKFSDELEGYFFQQDRHTPMSRFRREVIPLLLTNKGIEEKHADLNTLARAHFPIQNFGQQVVADILYFISGLFTWIKGVQAARNESTLFKSAEHIALSNKFRTAIQEVNSPSSEDPLPPPSTLGGGGK
jgi:hypothetical protein